MKKYVAVKDRRCIAAAAQLFIVNRRKPLAVSYIFGDLVYASHVVFIVVSARKAQKRKRYYDEYQ